VRKKNNSGEQGTRGVISLFNGRIGKKKGGEGKHERTDCKRRKDEPDPNAYKQNQEDIEASPSLRECPRKRHKKRSGGGGYIAAGDRGGKEMVGRVKGLGDCSQSFTHRGRGPRSFSTLRR